MSIFRAELLALRQVAEIIAESEVGEYVVLTVSSLESLSNNRISAHQPRACFELKRFIGQIYDRSSSVTFLWVPAHRGIPLNEAADVAANQARESGRLGSYHPSSLDINKNPYKPKI